MLNALRAHDNTKSSSRPRLAGGQGAPARPLRFGLVVLALALATASAVSAQPCNTAPQAVDDTALHLGDPIVVDVLANDIEPDGEALSVSSLSTTCAGTASEDFGLVTMVPASQVAEACTIAYQVSDERGATSSATVVVTSSGALFKDSFESGNTSAWAEVAR